MRLIDANALMEYLLEKLAMYDSVEAKMGLVPLTIRNDLQGFVETINEQPTIDAVTVRRCRECKHGITGHGIKGGWVLCSKPYVTDTVGSAMHRCDWYCADGERKDGEPYV